MEELTIAEVARRAGVAPSAIRYYESIKLLPEPRRVSGRRRYDAAAVEQLAFIQTAQSLGFSLADIQVLVQRRAGEVDLADRWHALATRKLAEVEDLIKRARTMKRLLVQGLHCRCADLEECVGCVLARCGPTRIREAIDKR